jgi:hypothetical protein
MSDPAYVPGQCNIGPAEVARRRSLGWSALVVTAVVIVAFAFVRMSPWWWLVLFLPATLSASGFLQARAHFCTGYAHAGLFSMGAPGTAQHVTSDADRALDRKTGNRIALRALLIGALVAVVAALLAMALRSTL